MSDSNEKIAVLGLDKAGKTSILMSLKRDRNLMDFCHLSPTRGINRVQLPDREEQEKHVLDFGGQAKYREGYLRDFQKYVKGSQKIIFVIDVKDWQRYDLALDYLREIIENIQKEELSVEFSIFLHKFDPDLQDEENWKLREEHIPKLVKDIEGIIPSKLNHEIFKTTIFTVFDKNSYY